MPPNLSRAVLNSLLPPGSIWIPENGSDLDKLFDGISDNSEAQRTILEKLAHIRNFQKTDLLTDLEKEFGLVKNDSLTEQERRDRGEAAKTSRFGFGADYLETRLQDAGFDIQVHINNPPVDPDIFLFHAFQIYCNDQTNAFCGNQAALAGGTNGELVVNGDLFEEFQIYVIASNNDIAYCGNQAALCGSPDDMIKRVPIEYTVPNDSGYWGLFFFVGGDATRDGSGALINIESADIPFTRREELRSLIVKYKPLHSWCGLIVNFI